jgi:hypothetical protein
MHHRLLITIGTGRNDDSERVRKEVFNRLMSDDSFCGEGGRFGSPLCDWFVIGGRWSGLLGEITLGSAFKDAARIRFPELARDWYPHSIAEKHASELNAIWQAHGGKGPSPYTRSGYEELGFEDDAAILTAVLYDALLVEYEGESTSEGYADLDDEALSRDSIGRKWLVVIDYHN